MPPVLIQAPEIVRRLANLLGLRATTIAPVVDDKITPVIIVDDLRDQIVAEDLRRTAMQTINNASAAGFRILGILNNWGPVTGTVVNPATQVVVVPKRLVITATVALEGGGSQMLIRLAIISAVNTATPNFGKYVDARALGVLNSSPRLSPVSFEIFQTNGTGIPASARIGDIMIPAGANNPSTIDLSGIKLASDQQLSIEFGNSLGVTAIDGQLVWDEWQVPVAGR